MIIYFCTVPRGIVAECFLKMKEHKQEIEY
jgi:hypothetical protein